MRTTCKPTIANFTGEAVDFLTGYTSTEYFFWSLDASRETGITIRNITTARAAPKPIPPAVAPVPPKAVR